MIAGLVLWLAACAGGDAARGDAAGDSAAPCGAPADPSRATDFGSIMGRLGAQGCLDAADTALALAAVDAFHAGTEWVWCDAVYRLSSPDGRSFAGEPELVHANASVPDVGLDAEGRHVVVFNDLGPDRFAATLQADPARFWRQGLIGLGGLSVAVEGADGWDESPIDLHLPEPALVVDPDLTRRADGDYRLTSFTVPGTALDGVEWDPYRMPGPHAFQRAVGADYAQLPAPALVVSSTAGSYGGADPTVLDDGADEILYLGDYSAPMVGWVAPGGVYPGADAAPDVHVPFVGGAPDITPDPAGGWRMYYADVSAGVLSLATSSDGRSWAPQGPVVTDTELGSPSVVRDADGVWWLYVMKRDPACEGG